MNYKKRIGQLYGKPIVIGDKNITSKNEIHIQELGNSDIQNNSKGYLWYDLTSANSSDTPYIANPIQEVLPYIPGALVAELVLERYIAVSPMAILTSGISISEHIYLGLPEYVYYNDEIFNFLDFVNTINDANPLSKNDFEKYLVPSSKVFTKPTITMAGM